MTRNNNKDSYTWTLVLFNTGEVIECNSSRTIAQILRYVWRKQGRKDEMRAVLYYKNKHVATFSEHKEHLWRTVPGKCNTMLVW